MLGYGRTIGTVSFIGLLVSFGCSGSTETLFAGTGQGGAGGVTSTMTSSDSPTGGTTSSQPTGSATTSTTTAEPTCPDWPCKLTHPQCGCEPGFKCTVDVGKKVACLPEAQSPIEEGQLCNDDCAAGLVCLPHEQPALCHRFCKSDADCVAAGSRCFYDLTNSGSPQVCTINCDPITSTGCPAPEMMCTAIYAEQKQSWASECVPAGSKGQGAACQQTQDCAPGHLCAYLLDGQMCLQFCKPQSGVCPIGTACASFSPQIHIGSIEYGACAPF